MIDTHSHLYLNEFAAQIDNYVTRAIELSVTKVFLPAIDTETHEQVISLSKQYPQICYPMMGLHPCSVKENYEEEIAAVEKLLEAHKFYGIGETGLDLHWDKTYAAEQADSLRRHVSLALKYDLPIILHTRNATTETINIISEYKDTSLRGIFHCFGGTIEEANAIIELGFLLGIGGVVTYKNGGLDKVLPHIELQHLVLETDAPYLSPVPHRGKQNEPSFLPLIAARIAEIKGVLLEEVVEHTTINAEKVFGF